MARWTQRKAGNYATGLYARQLAGESTPPPAHITHSLMAHMLKTHGFPEGALNASIVRSFLIIQGPFWDTCS